MKIRPYQEKDRDDCLGIFKSNIPKFFLHHEIEGFENFLDHLGHAKYWVLEMDGKICACGGIVVKDGEGRLCYGMVDSQWHHKGLGSKLLEFRLEKLQADPGVSEIGLDTSQHNPAFFSRFGFVETKVTPNSYGPGLHRHDMKWTKTK